MSTNIEVRTNEESPENQLPIKVRLSYPENRTVSEATILGWAFDAYLNEETNIKTSDLFEAIQVLEDLGQITVAKILY